jgi:starch synthase (maltosyl-transferring)
MVMHDSRDIQNSGGNPIAMAKQTRNRAAQLSPSVQPSARHIIEAIAPSVDCGRYPVKRVVGDSCVVEADIFRDGHDIIRAAVAWRRKDHDGFVETPMELADNDRWRGSFPLNENTHYVFTIRAWTDNYATWAADFVKKAAAGRKLAPDLQEGIAILRRNAALVRDDGRELVQRVRQDRSRASRGNCQ